MLQFELSISFHLYSLTTTSSRKNNWGNDVARIGTLLKALIPAIGTLIQAKSREKKREIGLSKG